MNDTPSAGLSRSDLARRVREVEPTALLIRSRLLRRIIKRHRQLPGLGLRVPHASCYALPREDLLRCARLDELGLSDPSTLPETVLLLPFPGPTELRPGRERRVLHTVSRRLLHAAIHRRFHERLSGGELTPDLIERRITALGESAWEEIRVVLQQERLLLPPYTPVSQYEEFASTFLELAYHAPHLLPRWFPALDNVESVQRMLEEDLQCDDLARQTLLPGTPHPGSQEDFEPAETEVILSPSTQGKAPELLRERAQRESQRGNLVRAAILKFRAGDRDAAYRIVRELAGRLGRAIHLDAEQVTRWERALGDLLEPAAKGSWTRAGRLLYDVQAVCTDHEKPFFAVDLVEWLNRRGGPLRRPLPAHGEVLSCGRLRRALDRVPGLPEPEAERDELFLLLTDALHRVEADVRKAFRPRLEAILQQVGFVPANHAEELARQKVVNELLEVIVQRGYLNLGHVRDTIARNRLKLADLSGPGEFLVGDALLKANSALTVQLDGVYHRGEFYLRWLQSVSSLVFGTSLGRWLTLFLVLPFLGSFLILKFAEEIAHFFTHAHFLSWESLGTTALLILLLLHSEGFRRLLWGGMRTAGAGLHWLFIEMPLAIFLWWPIQRILQSRAFLFALQVVIKPLGATMLVTLVAWLWGIPREYLLSLFLSVFFLSLVVLNSRLGQHLEEMTGDALLRTWGLIREDLLIGTFRFLRDLFRVLVERVDRIIYTVDEWLRFREGESRGSLLFKVIFGTLWWLITYVFRFVFIVLLEPQVNPIKHFPVVTVGHKVLLLAVDPTARWLSSTFEVPYDVKTIGAITLVYSLIPGFFGFLAWELVANWRLYRANQSPTLDPVRVGSHGETMRGLLRPGFHSGTIPKLFARLRHLPERQETPRLHRIHAGLHHAAEAVADFVQSDLVDALHGTKIWRDRVVLTVEEPRLDTRRIRIPIRATGLGDGTPLVLVFEQCGPWLVFSVAERGWVDQLRSNLAPLWRDALIGFLKHAGVQLTTAQLAKALPTGSRYRIEHKWLEATQLGKPTVRYSLTREGLLRPVDRNGVVVLNWPEIAAPSVRLDVHPVLWENWVEVWKTAQKGNKPRELLPGVPIPGCP